jgi:hypothetical protein
MNCRQILNEYCQKNGIELPVYFHVYSSEQKIGLVSAKLNSIEYKISGVFNSKKEANEDLARMILEKNNQGKGSPKISKNNAIILYADPSEENPFKEMLKILSIITSKNVSMENIKVIGFSRKSIIDNKFIINFTHNTVCENPNNELIWFVAKNYGDIKNSHVYIECNDSTIKEFLYEKLEKNN